MATYASSLVARTVHIRMWPLARTFAERTEVLRVLQSFGQVDYFKSLRHDGYPDAFLSIFNRTEDAANIINDSPIRYSLIAEPAPSVSEADPTATYDKPPSHKSPETEACDAAGVTDDAENHTPENEPPQPKERIFELRLSPGAFPHKSKIVSGPLYGHWKPISAKQSPIAADLVLRIPHNKVLAGLRDWETGAASRNLSELWDGSDADMEASAEQRNNPWRMRMKGGSKSDLTHTGNVITSLSKMYQSKLRLEQMKRAGQ